MAKITAEFDTLDKTLVVKKDGKSLSDVKYVSFGPYYGPYNPKEDTDEMYSCSISMEEHDEESGIRSMMSLSCSKQDEGSSDAQYKEIPEFKIKSRSTVAQNHINDYLSSFLG